MSYLTRVRRTAAQARYSFSLSLPGGPRRMTQALTSSSPSSCWTRTHRNPNRFVSKIRTILLRFFRVCWPHINPTSAAPKAPTKPSSIAARLPALLRRRPPRPPAKTSTSGEPRQTPSPPTPSFPHISSLRIDLTRCSTLFHPRSTRPSSTEASRRRPSLQRASIDHPKHLRHHRLHHQLRLDLLHPVVFPNPSLSLCFFLRRKSGHGTTATGAPPAGRAACIWSTTPEPSDL